MIRDIIFDFFGTLVAYRPDKVVDPGERRALDVLARHGVVIGFEALHAGLYRAFDEFEREARRTLREPHMHEIARAFLGGVGVADPPAALVEEFSRAYCEEWGATVSPADGLEELLDALSGRYRLSVLSNTYYPPLVHGVIARLGLAARFAAVHTSAEIGIRKPDRRAFEAALASLGARAGETIYVGDSHEADYLGATGAGLRAVLIDPLRKHEVAEGGRISRLAELGEVMVRLTA
jgi:putative hydrolase of the HAD superfamily